MAKKKTKAERDYMEKVTRLGCYIYRHYPEYRSECCTKLELHHPTGSGLALKSNYLDIIPLCFNHHSEQTPLPFGCAVHKGTKSFESRIEKQEQMSKETRIDVENYNDFY